MMTGQPNLIAERDGMKGIKDSRMPEREAIQLKIAFA